MVTKVVSVQSETTASEAASLMAHKRCSCLVVMKGEAAIGVVTERDMVRRILAIHVDPSKVFVSDVMSAPIITVGPKATVVEAAEKMSEYLVRRLVVVDETGSIVGLITASDIAKLLAKTKAYSDSVLNAMARMRKDGTGGPYE